jgi:hypothetical protein
MRSETNPNKAKRSENVAYLFRKLKRKAYETGGMEAKIKFKQKRDTPFSSIGLAQGEQISSASCRSRIGAPLKEAVTLIYAPTGQQYLAIDGFRKNKEQNFVFPLIRKKNCAFFLISTFLAHFMHAGKFSGEPIT